MEVVLVVLRCKNDVCVGVVFVNFTMLSIFYVVQPEYQAFLGKRGKMEAKKEESLLSPSPVERPDTQANVVCLAFHRWCHAVVIIVSRFTVGY